MLHWAVNRVWIKVTNSWLAGPTLVALHCGDNKFAAEHDIFQVFFSPCSGNGRFFSSERKAPIWKFHNNNFALASIPTFIWIFCLHFANSQKIKIVNLHHTCWNINKICIAYNANDGTKNLFKQSKNATGIEIYLLFLQWKFSRRLDHPGDEMKAKQIVKENFQRSLVFFGIFNEWQSGISKNYLFSFIFNATFNIFEVLHIFFASNLPWYSVKIDFHAHNLSQIILKCMFWFWTSAWFS